MGQVVLNAVEANAAGGALVVVSKGESGNAAPTLAFS